MRPVFDLSTPLEFRPELLPRRGEWIAWAFALVMLATWLILKANDARYTGTALILLIFLAFAAVGTSLGNWLDRKSILRLARDGVAFQNGLRDVKFTWQEVQSVRVLVAQAGARRVQVLGRTAHFEFRTLATLRQNDEVKGRSGFADGDAILDIIISRAQLSRKQNETNYATYARD